MKRGIRDIIQRHYDARAELEIRLMSVMHATEIVYGGQVLIEEANIAGGLLLIEMLHVANGGPKQILLPIPPALIDENDEREIVLWIREHANEQEEYDL